jgi:hypothetical protein
MEQVAEETKPDATGGVIPYKNPHALIAYYCGIFSLIPFIGVIVAIPGFILGIIGLRKRRENPMLKGAVHAWIGIVLGGLMTILWGGFIVLAIFGAMAAANH